MSAETGRSANKLTIAGSVFQAEGAIRASETFAMMEVNQAKQLKGLQQENARLKRMLADGMLGKELLKEALEKSYEPRTQTSDS